MDLMQDHPALSKTQIEARMHLAAIVESSSDAIVSKTLGGIILSWNKAAERVFGYTASEAIGQPITIVIPEERLGEEELILEKIRRGEPIEPFETVRQRKDGSQIDIALTVSPIRTEEGRIIGASKIARDITAQKRAERDLRMLEARLGLIVSNAPVIMCVFDDPHHVALLEGKGLSLVGLDDSGGRVKERWAAMLPNWLRKAVAVCFEGIPTADTGPIGKCWFEAHFAPLRDDSGRVSGATGILLDITAQRQMQEELFRAGKLESIGVLAGGIAHDFNNILTAIAGNLALTRLRVTDDPEAHATLHAAETAALRARGLTQQLLTFTKGGKPVTRRMAVDRALREAVEFAIRSVGVTADVQIAPDLWPITGDEGQIAQMLHNLLINAQQAMPEGGRITVRARNRVLRPAESVLSPGDYVQIEIEDTGEGIRPEHVPKIFDPFFTTKAGGSGLGLTSSYSIVKNHEGLMTVSSVWGRGSTFHVLLPRSTVAPELPVPSELLVRGRGHVLFMDDEPEILQFAEHVLPVLGYRAAVATRGEQVIEMFERAAAEGDPFDAVVLDLMVRDGLGGVDTLNALRGRDAGVVAIVSSGYANDPIMADFRNYGFFACVAKPYSIEALSTVVNRAVRAAAERTAEPKIRPAGR
ncbi:MAG: two-component system sensor histidine kinase NtrB [Acidiferrobacteraceae bacterium]